MLVSIYTKICWRLRRFLIPRPARGAEALKAEYIGRLAVAGLFRTGSGMGQAARNCYEGLRNTGIEAQAIDLSKEFNQLDMAYSDAISVEVCTKFDTLILHLNAPEVERSLFALRNKFAGSPRIIGYWAWELPEIPNVWLEAEKYLSEIWAPSEFVAQSLRKSFKLPVKVVPHYVPEIELNEKKLVADSSCFKCLAMADARSSFDRKNIKAAILAFKEAFKTDSDVKLVLKTRNFDELGQNKKKVLSLIDKDERIEILDATLEKQKVLELISEADVFLSLHRSEGFGLIMAEAMLQKTHVVATGWSGNLEFMNSTNSNLVTFDLVPVEDTQRVYDSSETIFWAEPSISDAAKNLRRLKNSSNEGLNLLQQAKIDVVNRLSASNYQKALGLGAL